MGTQPVTGDGSADPLGSPAGEFVSIPEWIVVAPHWGRLHGGAVDSGFQLERGEVLGHLRDTGIETPLVAPVRAVFVGWLVSDRQRVSPGTPLALLRRLDGQT